MFYWITSKPSRSPKDAINGSTIVEVARRVSVDMFLHERFYMNLQKWEARLALV